MSFMWTAFLMVILLILLCLLLKFFVCNCVVLQRNDDVIPILSRNESYWSGFSERRAQALRIRQPPPEFEEALRSSRPVSLIHIDEEPPPTYDEFLKSQSTTPTSDSSSISICGDGAVGHPGQLPTDRRELNSPFDSDFVIPPTPSELDPDSDFNLSLHVRALCEAKLSKTQKPMEESEA